MATLPGFLMSLITNINLSGLHPIDAFMRYMNYMRFMKSGKNLANNRSQGLSLSG
jgi:hypothetical protein